MDRQDEARGIVGMDIVRAWRAELSRHPGLAALREHSRLMSGSGGHGQPFGPSAGGLAQARAFVCSLYAFNRATPAGIAQLAGRWADALARTDPFGAHRVAARVLASAVDEFGLAGTRPHLELFMEFGARWGIAPEVIVDRAWAVPSARDLGDRVEEWYRTAPLTVSLTVHFVSEETSAEEFAVWYPIFPDAEYTRVHAELEPGHSSDAMHALGRHLGDHPEEIAVAFAAIEPYLSRYRGMWDELLALGGGLRAVA